MAERLQKILNTNVDVASVGSPPQQQDRTGNLLQGVVQGVRAVEGIVGAVKKTELTEELGRLGEEVSAVTEGVDLKDATDRFKRLKKAKEQGILDDSRINIEAEAILKQKIGVNSAFAPELRQAAADILGFDPTGSTLQKLFGKSGRTSPSRSMTAEQKLRAKAENIAGKLNLNPDDVERSFLKAQLGEAQMKNMSQQVRLGEVNADSLLTTALDNSDAFLSDSLAQFMIDVDDGGLNPADSSQRQASLQAAKTAGWQQYRQSLVESGTTLSASQLSERRKEFDAGYEDVSQLFADQGTMEALSGAQSKTMSNLASIQGFNAFGGVAAINAGMGQAGVTEYFRTAADPGQLQLLARSNPALASILSSREGLARSSRGAFNTVMGLPVDSRDVVYPEVVDSVSRKITKTAVDSDTRARNLSFLQSRGQSFKDFGDYAQPGSRALVTQEEVQYVQERWGVEAEPLIARVASAVRSTEGVDLVVSNGVLKVQSTGAVVPGAPTGMQILGNFAQIPTGLENDIKRLNGMNRLLTNGWAGDVGERAEGFLERTINKVGTLNADEVPSNAPDPIGTAFDAFLSSPTPENLEALGKLDPELVTAAKSLILQQGESSGQ